MAKQPGNGKDQSQEVGKQFQIQKIYLKDVSLETPNTPHVFQQTWQPDVTIQLGNSAQVLTEDVHEVITTVTVTAKLADKTAFLVEVQQAGIFSITGYSAEERGMLLGSYCPTVLFPYAREAVSDLVVKAGFPQLLLAPVNFEALYAQHLENMKTKQPESLDAAH